MFCVFKTMKLPHKTLERKLFANGYSLIFAVDEVGMGCLAGPVVVCAVAFRKKFFNRRNKKLNWLRDSKLLQAKQREEFAGELAKNEDIRFQICYVYPKTIDKLNIYQASREAMRRAIKKLYQVLCIKYYAKNPETHDTYYMIHNTKSIVLVDGPNKISGLNMEQLPIVKGDRKVFAIACASIIAKVHRDKMMVRYAKKYPGYGFEKHKGYGTKYHQVKLASLGPLEIHRKSFAPVAKLL